MYRVAIVGRPNVGKSTLFNRLTRTRKAIVGDEAGITRDRIFETAEWNGKFFEIVDTGGIDPGDREVIAEKVLEQAAVAVEGADLVLLVVDARTGLIPLDEEAAAFLQSQGAEFWVVVNKVDVEKVEVEAYQFASLGADRLLPVSAEHRLGIDDLVSEITDRIPETPAPEAAEEIRIAIIGRPNVGKSSLVNRILGTERVIVSEIPGTTRDSVDSHFLLQGNSFRIVDTAGIRRKGRTELMAEKLSVVMARKHMGQADVVFLVLDPTEGATKLDAAIGGYAHDEGKGLIIVVNKWDLVEKDTHTAAATEAEYRRRMRFLDYAPLVFVSATTGQRVHRLLDLAVEVWREGKARVATAELNSFLQEEVAAAVVHRGSSRKFPIKYACQVGSLPPSFALFLRGREKLHFSTVRFISNQLRERYGFFGNPIRILQRPQRKFKKNQRLRS